MVAVLEAIRFCQSLFIVKPIAIFTDTRCAMRRIASPFPRDCLTSDNRLSAPKLAQSSNPVTVQWIHSHVGIPGNEKTDKLASAARSLPSSTSCPPDPRRLRYEVRSFFELAADPKPSPFASRCVFEGFSRSQLTLLPRHQTRSARTRLPVQGWSCNISPISTLSTRLRTTEHLDMCSDHSSHSATLCPHLNYRGSRWGTIGL